MRQDRLIGQKTPLPGRCKCAERRTVMHAVVPEPAGPVKHTGRSVCFAPQNDPPMELRGCGSLAPTPPTQNTLSIKVVLTRFL